MTAPKCLKTRRTTEKDSGLSPWDQRKTTPLTAGLGPALEKGPAARHSLAASLASCSLQTHRVGCLLVRPSLRVLFEVVAMDDWQHSFVTHFLTGTSHTSQISVEVAVECLVLARASFAVVPLTFWLCPDAEVDVPDGERVREDRQ